MHRSPLPFPNALFLSLTALWLAASSSGLQAAQGPQAQKVAISKQTPALPTTSSGAASAKLVLPKPAAAVLEDYCISCHEEGTTKGDVRLDNLTEISEDSQLDLLNRALEQVFLREMPPKKKKQPSENERKLLADWLTNELRTRNSARFEEKLRFPNYGNSVDHTQLFSGKITDPPYSPDRRWLVSPQIFINRVVDIYGPGIKIPPGNLHLVGVSNPVTLPDTPVHHPLRLPLFHGPQRNVVRFQDPH